MQEDIKMPHLIKPNTRVLSIWFSPLKSSEKFIIFLSFIQYGEMIV